MTKNLKAQAVDAIRSGDKRTARRLLMNHLAVNSDDDRAWLILSAAVDSELKRRECLETALRINPHNEVAREQLRKLDSMSGVVGSTGSIEKGPSPTDVGGAKELTGATSTAATRLPRLSRQSPGVIGIFAVAVLCLGCFAIYAFIGWLGGNDANRVADGGVATRVQTAPSRSLPATNTPRRQAVDDAELTTGQCPGIDDYLNAIDDDLADFAELGSRSYSSTTDVELALYAERMLEKYENFAEIAAPDCARVDAIEISEGMAEMLLAITDFALANIDHVEASNRAKEGARQMLRGYNNLLVMADEQPFEEPEPGQREFQVTRVASATSMPALPPTVRATATPDLLPVGSSLAVDDGLTTWEVTVTNIDFRSEMNLEVGGELMQRHIAEHRYAVFFLNAVNTGRQTDFFFPYSLVVRDGSGREYEHDQVVTGIAEGFVYELDEFANEAHPGEVAQTVAVFDLPFGAGPFSLQYDWFNLTGETYPGVLLDIQD